MVVGQWGRGVNDGGRMVSGDDEERERERKARRVKETRQKCSMGWVKKRRFKGRGVNKRRKKKMDGERLGRG